MASSTQDNESRMANVRTRKGTIAILTGGGDVPGLNPAIRALTVRALREGYRVLGIRRGWAGLVDLDRGRGQVTPEHVIELSEEVVNKVGRTGGTFLHTSRTRPSHLPLANLPLHLKDRYTDEVNDVTEDILANLSAQRTEAANLTRPRPRSGSPPTEVVCGITNFDHVCQYGADAPGSRVTQCWVSYTIRTT